MFHKDHTKHKVFYSRQTHTQPNENKAGITNSLKALKEQNDELKKSIADKNSELTNIKNNIAKNSSTNWELPTFGNSTQFKADEVLILCSQFGGLEDGDFEIF